MLLTLRFFCVLGSCIRGESLQAEFQHEQSELLLKEKGQPFLQRSLLFDEHGAVICHLLLLKGAWSQWATLIAPTPMALGLTLALAALPGASPGDPGIACMRGCKPDSDGVLPGATWRVGLRNRRGAGALLPKKRLELVLGCPHPQGPLKAGPYKVPKGFIRPLF